MTFKIELLTVDDETLTHYLVIIHIIIIIIITIIITIDVIISKVG